MLSYCRELEWKKEDQAAAAVVITVVSVSSSRHLTTFVSWEENVLPSTGVMGFGPVLPRAMAVGGERSRWAVIPVCVSLAQL